MDNIQYIEDKLKVKGMSQTKLATLLDINLTTVNNWFRRGKIPDKYEEKILDILKLKPLQSQENLFEVENSVGINNTKQKKVVTLNTASTSLQHIDSKNTEYFQIDSSLFTSHGQEKLRFNSFLHQSHRQVHIIDREIQEYCGDGIYYILYPHGLVYVDILYHPQFNNYQINPLLNTSKMYQMTELTLTILGRVIYKIESL